MKNTNVLLYFRNVNYEWNIKQQIKQTPVGVYYHNTMYSTYNLFVNISRVTSATDWPYRKIESMGNVNRTVNNIVMPHLYPRLKMSPKVHIRVFPLP